MPVQFLDPIADCMVPAQPYDLCASIVEGTTVGLVVNKIVHCDVFMRHVGEALLQVRPGVNLITYETGTITFADDELIEQVVTDCDAAICAIGHCGSCTAGTVKDGINIIRRGIPAVALVTELFWDQANALARSLGWPDAPRVKLPYPIWGTDEATMKQAADTALHELLPLLERSDAQAA